MTEYGFSNPKLIVLFSMTFMGYLAFPGVAANLWQGIKDNKAKKLCRKKREREERLKKYWEIDMRNFK
jgi:hypothetical protein